MSRANDDSAPSPPKNTLRNPPRNPPKNDLASRRAWRTRVPERRRALAAVATVAALVAAGAVFLTMIIAVMLRVDLASWIVALPWVVPTVAAMWLAQRAQHAADPEADNVGWVRWSIQRVIAGEGQLAPLWTRLAIATLIGAPLAWGLLVGFMIDNYP